MYKIKELTYRLDGGKEIGVKNNIKCANCGRVPVTGSTLCVECLAAYDLGQKDKDDELIKVKLQLNLQRRLLRHVFAEYQEKMKLGGGKIC